MIIDIFRDIIFLIYLLLAFVAYMFLMGGIPVLLYMLFSCVLDWIAIFQLKEYRIDRIWDFITSKKGLTFLLRPAIVGWPLLGVLGFFWLYRYEYVLDTMSGFSIAAIVVAYAALYDYVFVQKRFPRPAITFKSALLVGICTISFLGPILYLDLSQILPDDVTDKIIAGILFFAPLIFFIIVQIIQIPTFFIKKRRIAAATKKLATYEHLRVVGITGSYGKTSTRTFLVHILSQQYRVVTTPKNINTEIGIANFILSHDFSEDQVFVVEMGAYRRGEIKIIADMVRPHMGILTSIGPEHLSLFGSIENIRDTKAELLHALPQHGVAILNQDDEHCQYIKERLSVPTYTFGKDPSVVSDVQIISTETNATGTKITLKYRGGEEYTWQLPIYGTHHAYNVAAVFLGATICGMPHEAVEQAIQTLPQVPHRLEVIKKNIHTVIDDTYNANPKGFEEALSILSLQPQTQKIVMTRGMLELGEVSKKEHIRIGEIIGKVADTLYILSPDAAKELITGARSTNPEIIIKKVYDVPSMTLVYRDIIQQETPTALLLENRISADVLNDLAE